MTGVSRAIIWATLSTAVILAVELAVFAFVGPLPSPIPDIETSMPIIISTIILSLVFLRLTHAVSTPPTIDMRDEYELSNKYHWPIDER